ncbi:MAG: YdcF family protein [Chloroflexi bacterium]|nr:YdcF family protein [Chloroflexota bacterium]
MPLVQSSDFILIPKRKARRALGGVLLGLAAIITLHPLWLPLIARALIVDEPLQKADAIVVLGGGNGERDATAARLWAEGWAPIIITTGDKIPLPGLPDATWATLSLAELLRLGVPESAIIAIDGSSSTCDDARLAVAQLPSGAKRVIIVTDPFHTRRAEWLFQKGAAEADVITAAANPSWFDPDRWWTEDRGIIVVGQEYVKLGINLLKGCG